MIDALLGGELCTRLLVTFLHLWWQVGLIWLVVWYADRTMKEGPAAKRYQLHAVALLSIPVIAIATFCIVERPSKLMTANSVEVFETARYDSDDTNEPATLSTNDDSEEQHPSPSVAVSTPTIQQKLTARWHDDFSIWIVGAYALGVAFFLLRLAKAAWGGHQLKLDSLPIADPELLNIAKSQAQLLGIKIAPIIAYCDSVAVPTVIGIVRPMILLPGSLATGLTTEEFGSVISHELAHISRHDLLMNWAQRVIEAVFFFHPAVWHFSRRLSEERESCCDDLVVSAGHEPLSYASTLLRLAEGYSANQQETMVALAATGEKKGQFEIRIERLMTTAEVSRVRMTRFSFAALLAILLLSCFAPLYWYGTALAREIEGSATDSSTPLEPRNPFEGSGYTITGTVRDRVTKASIANADIRVLVIGETRQLVTAVSDDAGKYRVEVPMGQVRFWYPRLRVGYWISPQEAMRPLTTSPEEPTLVHDIEAEPGKTWPFKVEFDRKTVPALHDWMVSVQEIEDDEMRKALMEGKQVSFQEHNNMMMYNMSSDGIGAITQVGESGRMIYGVGDTNGAGVSGELLVDPEFDNQNVEDIRRDGKRTTLIDAVGNEAVITNADVDLKEGVAHITFKPKDVKPPPKKTIRVSGRIVDDANRPVRDARVGLALGSEGGSGDSGASALTDANGNFEINHSRVWPKGMSWSKPYAQLNVNKKGFAAFESKKWKLSRFRKTIKFGELKLESGYSLPVKVVNESGKPLPGATVEPQGNYALRRQVIRVDEQGHGVLRNLPSGVVSATVTHNQSAQWKKLVVGDSDDNQEVTITLSSPDAPKTPLPASRNPIEIGKSAPDWFLGDWLDGEARQLSDFRGKVLVLDFWGVWCSPCVNAIPGMKKLEEHYAGSEVAFVSIHTPDGDPEQIARLQDLKNWKPLTAIDLGTTNYDGETAAAYGVRGYPTVLIIDQQGKVAFSTDGAHVDRDEMMNRAEELAKSKGNSWPIDKEDDEKMIKLANAVTTHVLKEQIDKVVLAGAK